jgi:hypothetical protein
VEDCFPPHTPSADPQLQKQRGGLGIEPLRSDLPVGGRLEKFQAAWQSAPKWHRQVVSRGLSWKFTTKRKPSNLPPSHQPSLSPEMELQLRHLQQVRVIERVSGSPRCISRLFGVRKPSGKLRVILDLTQLNLLLHPVTFRLPSLKDVRSLLHRPTWLAKIDLQDAYHHVAIHPKYRPFLSFRWNKGIYWYRALPFGLSLAPAVFTGLMGHPLKLLREQGVQCYVYLDDWLIAADSEETCQRAIEITLRMLSDLGFLVNKSKSVLRPQQELCWLGVQWQGLQRELRLPWEKCLRLQSHVLRWLQHPLASRREFESLLGEMAFAAQILPEAQHEKKIVAPFIHHWDQVTSRDSVILIPQSLLHCLLWWTCPSRLHQWQRANDPPPTHWLWTDASLLGWGAHLGDGSWRAGDWTTEDLTYHIGDLEILAVIEALSSTLLPRGAHVRIHTDSAVTFWVITKQGSRSSRRLTNHVALLRRVCNQRENTLEMVRIPSWTLAIAYYPENGN